MFGFREVLDYLRFLRHKEELEKVIKNNILNTNPKCSVCGFEYTTIEDIYKRLPVIALTTKKYVYNLVCKGCRNEGIKKIFNGEN